MEEAVTVEENGVKIFVPPDSAHPLQSVPFFNARMCNNRFLVYLALRTLAKEREGVLECLDAFSGSGVMAIQWKRHLLSRVAVYVSEMNKVACSWIRRNFEENQLKVAEANCSDLDDDRPPANESLLLQEDCSVVLLRKGFDFVHLDPFGSAALHLEPAFRRLRQHGLLTITSTDVASLFARNPQVVRRNYGAAVVKTEYVKEMAVRIIVAAAVRAAARFGKGVRVVFCASSDHFLLVCLRICRGAAAIDASLAQIAPLLHCRLCEERVFLPADQLAPLEAPYSLLPCRCRAENEGRTGVVLGPMWKGPIFCPDFVARLLAEANGQSRTPSGLRLTLKLIALEAGLANAEQQEETEPVSKKARPGDECVESPFYYFPAKMKLANVDLPKIDALCSHLRSRGIWCSRTHFEPTALRAACSLADIKAAILELQKH